MTNLFRHRVTGALYTVSGAAVTPYYAGTPVRHGRSDHGRWEVRTADLVPAPETDYKHADTVRRFYQSVSKTARRN